MEACAEIVFRSSCLIDPIQMAFTSIGPILQKEYKSFVGMHPMPIVHGMTVGELAQLLMKKDGLKME